MSELTTEQIAEIKARRAAITGGQWFYASANAIVWSRYGDEINDCEIVAEPNGGSDDDFGDANGEFIAHAPDDIDALLAALEAERADNERLREKMAWLGKGKMRPLEQRYQAFLRHDAEQHYDDTPPDYVEWLEQIAMGDIHLVEAPREGILADAQQRLNAKVANVPFFNPDEMVRVLDVAAEHYSQVGVIKHPRDDDGEYYVEFNEDPFNFDWFTEEALERVPKAPAVNPAAGQDGE